MQLSDFKTYVKYDFKRTDKDTELVQCYNDSILAVSIRMPMSPYKYQSYVPTRDGQEDYPLPTEMVHFLHPVRLLEGSDPNDSGWTLDYVSKDDYDLLEPNPNRTNPNDKGDPLSYTVYSSSLLLWPIPDDDTHIIEINWTKQPTDLSAASAEPALGDTWREVLKQMTLARLFAMVEQYDKAQFWRAMYEDQYGEPLGTYRDLLAIETDREINKMGNIRPRKYV